MMPIFQYRGGFMDLGKKTCVMGILNITPDSFSDGGRYFDTAAAVAHALEIEQEGAGILDMGAQSTRPGHVPVSAEEEWARLEPVLREVAGRVSIPISIDTYYPEVAAAALEAGAHIINDVSGSMQNGMPKLAAKYGAGLIMMHAGGGADDRDGGNVPEQVRAYFEQALALAARSGLSRQAVCLDVGIGFGSSTDGDLELIAQLPRLLRGLPETAVLVGASRKRVIGACCGNPPFEQRLAGTLALHSLAQWNGAHILRAHDVAAAVQAAAVTDALKKRRDAHEQQSQNR